MTLAASDVPAHALFVDYRTADGRHLEPEIFPRLDGEVYVCGMADPAPLPDSPDGVEVSEASCAVLARAAGRVSTALAAAPILRRQACYRPVTDDGLPLIGRVPGVAGAYVATGHGPWGMLNAPATGLALAELITEGTASSVDLRPFDPARLPAVRRAVTTAHGPDTAATAASAQQACQDQGRIHMAQLQRCESRRAAGCARRYFLRRRSSRGAA